MEHQTTEDCNPRTSENLRLSRCVDWIQKQNNIEDTAIPDLRFPFQKDPDQQKYSTPSFVDSESVPPAVDDRVAEASRPVPLRKLQKEGYVLLCEWKTCQHSTSDYAEFQKHVRDHVADLQIVECDGEASYACLWDICNHKTACPKEIVRHVNYHAYHARLLAIGFNARATLKLVRCRKDSSKRHTLPLIKQDYTCRWTDCDQTFNSIQLFLDHMKLHVNYCDRLICEWAGCGAVFYRKMFLATHMRSHTGERQIACCHCGAHFVSNRKLADHLRRQNVDPRSARTCNVCGRSCATEYLLRAHTRSHVSVHACSMCDMSAPTLAALAAHCRYRHLPAARAHACRHCDHRSVTKWDHLKHVATHFKDKKRPMKKNKRVVSQDESGSDSATPRDTKEYRGNSESDASFTPRAAKRVLGDSGSDNDYTPTSNRGKAFTAGGAPTSKRGKRYVCHICPEDQRRFSRGTRLTTHLINTHGARWPFGYSRFRYQVSSDGLYRLTTTRIESLEVSRNIVDRRAPTDTVNAYEFDIVKVASASEVTPEHFKIVFKGTDAEADVNVKERQSEGSDNEDDMEDDGEGSDSDASEQLDAREVCAIKMEPDDAEEPPRVHTKLEPSDAVEIEMCDVDEHGQIISSETIKSNVIHR